MPVAVTSSVVVESIPLNRAVLCQDCAMITAAENGHCPVCESKALTNLEKLLNRIPKNKPEPVPEANFYKPIQRSC